MAQKECGLGLRPFTKTNLMCCLPTLELYADLVDFDCRVIKSRRNSFDSFLSDDTNNENRHDLKGRIPRPCRREIAPAQIGHPGEDAGRRVAFRDVDLLGGALRIAIIESDKLLDLLL